MSSSVETKVERRVEVRRVFKAARARVFKAWTDPAIMRKWWCPQDDCHLTSAEIDLRVNGQYRLAMSKPGKPGELNVVSGLYTEVVANERVVFTWHWENHPAEKTTRVTIEFRDAAGGGTEVTLTHVGFPDDNMATEHKKGWTGIFAAFETQAGSL
jgi:uncharacterized protein YndB with AHSA1/START domain